MSYGYHRAEIIGALASVLLIWGLTFWLVVEAIYRVINPPGIDASKQKFWLILKKFVLWNTMRNSLLIY